MAHKGFTLEVNRPPCYRAPLVRLVEKTGLIVEESDHKTLFKVRHGSLKKFADLKAVLAGIMKHRKGSIFLVSHKTGRSWIMKVGGNRPRKFVRQ
jgi:hypothetical protein